MAKKKAKHRKILPPLEEIIGGSTSDLVSEALKKVMHPYPSRQEEFRSGEPSITQIDESRATSEPSDKETELQENSATETLGYENTELQHSRVIEKPRSDIPVIQDPSKNITQLPQSSAML